MATLSASAQQQTADSTGQVDFNNDIRPILSNRCFQCHGPDDESREADLRLDLPGEDYVIEAGDPDESELFIRIDSDDPDEVMPPPEHGQPLTANEIKLFAEWIRQGANYERHWSYRRIEKPPLPVTKDLAWPKNEIDAFVLHRMQQNQLRGSPPADRYTIIRRVALDLTGLPPTIEEADHFVSDHTVGAYERMVDHFLHKPAYGERWAAIWLDLARYADSAGYAEDKQRTIWAYRDYVIRAYNENLPFDQFTVEQIAGDLLADPSNRQLIATAFHRNTLTNSEGGTSDEEFRSAAIVDRVNTTMAVWMGTTINCAQCHTHKYDPLTQKEYFQLYAFFNNTRDNDQADERPLLPVYSDKDEASKSELVKKIQALEAQRQRHANSEKQKEWEQLIAESGRDELAGRYVRIELPDSDKRILSLAEVQVFSGDVNLAARGTASQSSTDYEGPAELAIDGNTSGNFEDGTVTHTASEPAPWWQVDLGLTTPIDRISIWNRMGANLPQRLNGAVVSVLNEQQQPVWTRRFEKALVSERVVAIGQVDPQIVAICQKNIDGRTDDEQKQLKEYFWQRQASRDPSQLFVISLESELNSIKPITTVPVMSEINLVKSRRKTNVHVRGNYLNLDEEVSEATPSAFHPLPDGSARDRLALARWLVDEANPLTARVLVNRYWQQFFGIGLVSTSEEFGAQGELPSHPQLLDWLAADFMEHDWDSKRLVKQIVMSATYRQQSRVNSVDLQSDPSNRWLARGPRVRLSAEMIRDQALAAGGLLSSKMFGPPVQPPQPKVGLKPAFTGESTDWMDSTGEDRYRRGLYTEWRRSAPYASMATFDVSSRDVCEIQRSQTNTPLQALVTLNDPVYIEAAQGLARRINDLESTEVRQRAIYAFRVCLIRRPSESEIARIVDLYQQALGHFSDKPVAAKLLANDPLNPLPVTADFPSMAAWTTVANVLLNLDEMLMKP